MTLLSEFIRVFELPPAMIPHVHLVADPAEMALVVLLEGRHLTLEEMAEQTGVPSEEAEELLRKAYYRGTVAKKADDGVARYTAATFYHRLDVLSMYEAWGDVPAEARDAVIEWDMQEFIKRWQPAIEEIRSAPDAAVHLPNRDVLQLDEALAMVDAAEKHAVLPCDCRTITMACQRRVEACIRLNDAAAALEDRGIGRQLSKEECKQLVIDLDREGLMHTGDRDWRSLEKPYGFCNCCACDCFPIRAGIRLGIERQWPRAHHIVDRDGEACIQCGACAERCHFHAFYWDEQGMIAFDAEKCWGCGICANGCPEEGITMRPLPPPPLE